MERNIKSKNIKFGIYLFYIKSKEFSEYVLTKVQIHNIILAKKGVKKYGKKHKKQKH